MRNVYYAFVGIIYTESFCFIYCDVVAGMSEMEVIQPLGGHIREQKSLSFQLFV